MSGKKLLVITSFPPKGIIHDKSVVGIASYAKNTLLGLGKYSPEANISVLAEILDKKEAYQDEGIEVKRVWRRGSFSAFPAILKAILSSRNTKDILLEFEVAMFGDFIYLLPLPVFLLILRLTGKKVTVVSHQVITDIEELSGHININSKLSMALFNFFIRTFYRLLLLLASKIIVFDDVLKKNLSTFGNPNKIAVIPHGVEEFKNIPSRQDSRSKLNIVQNDFVLLYFGFLAWYKGTDLLIDYYTKLQTQDKSIKLIVAGGANPNHTGKKYYQNYIANLEANCKAGNVSLTGFVKEEDIPTYFQAADLVVLPYRTLMSASGPLSMAFSFKKPFVVSKELSAMFETRDIKSDLTKLDIEQKTLVFANNDFAQTILEIKNNPLLREKIESLSKVIAEKRGWDKIGQLYYETLFQ